MIVPCTGVYDGQVDGESVIFSALDRRLHVLNSTAGQIWAAAAGGATSDEIISDLAGIYHTDPATISPDVLRLIDRLTDEGLLHLDGSCDHGDELAGRVSRDGTVADVAMVGTIGDRPVATIRALGVPIIIETNDSLLRSELSGVFAPLRASDVDLEEPTDVRRLQHLVVHAVDKTWRVMRNGATSSTVFSREHAIRAVVAECNTAPLPHVDDAVVLHAAAADLGRGNVLFAGVSNAGKSTLVAQLVQRGHQYVTDEACAVDLGSLTVRPFTKSICLEAGAQRLFPEVRSSTTAGAAVDVDPRTLGPGRLGAGGPIVAVVFPRFDPTSSPGLRPLDELDSLRRLIGNAFVFDHIGASAFDAVVQMATTLAFYELVHAGGTRHLDQLEDLFGDRTTLSL